MLVIMSARQYLNTKKKTVSKESEVLGGHLEADPYQPQRIGTTSKQHQPQFMQSLDFGASTYQVANEQDPHTSIAIVSDVPNDE